MVQLSRKEMRSLRLVVTPEGEIRLSLPHRVSDEDARKFVMERANWIRKHLERIESGKQPSDYSSIPYLGVNYPAEIIHHPISPRVNLDSSGKITVYLKPGTPLTELAGVLDAWYRVELRKLLEELVREWEPIMGVQVNAIQLKRMKTRWGTCNVVDHRIWFNVELMKKSYPCIEYIVVHEMCHLHERGHGPRFKACMDKYLPHWRLLRHELNGKGSKY
jgi:predicted metal-dependent hydrolase